MKDEEEDIELDLPEIQYKYSDVSANSSYDDRCEYRPLFTFVSSNELFGSITDKLSDMHIQMQIDSSLSLFLLYKYKWNREKLQEVYYESLEKDYAIKNKQIALKRQKVGVCSICFEKTKLYCNPLCIHEYCAECWHSYMKEKLTNREIFFPCMYGQKCRDSPILKQFVDQLAPDLSSLYIKQICINYAQECRTVSACCNAYCQLFCEKKPMIELNVVQCKCDAVYCFKCSRETHFPIQCGEISQWELNNEKNYELWLKMFTKNCPNCKKPIEKIVGCGKMICICSCVFCFFCGNRWSQNHNQNSCLVKENQLKSDRKGKEFSLIAMREKIVYFQKEKDRQIKKINQCLKQLSMKQIYEWLREFKKIITCAWNIFKWSIVSLFLKQIQSIQIDLQKDYVKKIEQLNEPIQKIIYFIKEKNYSHIYHLLDMINNMKQQFKKTQAVWTTAYNVALQTKNAKI